MMLSVIIPTYNEEDFLPALLQSLKDQAYRDFEVIVADARSTDRTREIAASYGCRVIDGGLPAVGRNRGAAAAQGDLFLFLDADVILPDQNFFSEILREFGRRKMDISTCRIDPMTDDPRDRFFHWVFNAYVIGSQRLFPHAPGFFILIKRSVFEAVRGFDEAIRLAEDHDLTSRAAEIGRFRIIRSRTLPVSVRRFERDGRMNVIMKYLLAELYIRAFGPVHSDIFKYRFGYRKGSGSRHGEAAVAASRALASKDFIDR